MQPPSVNLHTDQDASDDIGLLWVKASRRLAELKGYLRGSTLSSVWVHTVNFVEAMDSCRAQCDGLDVVILARDSVMRESARSPESKDALQGMAALNKMLAWPGQQALTTNDVLTVQSLLCSENAGLRTNPAPQALTQWLRSWDQATRADAHPDTLLQLPLLHVSWLQLQPMTSDHQRMGRLMDILLLQRAGLLPSTTLLWSRALLAASQKLEGRSRMAGLSPESPIVRQIYLLRVLDSAASMTLQMLVDLTALWSEVNHAIQAQHKFYSHELVLHLFRRPATRVELLAHDAAVTRLTATRYLDALVDTGILQLERHGRDNIYMHGALQVVLQPPPKPQARLG